MVENQSPSFIDNTFTNNISEEITGGNIYLTLSEHFSQFISIKREKIDYKSESVFTRDYANFSSESFQDDISIQNWNNRYDNINDQFNDFHWRLDECINRHAPFKKLSPGEIKLKCKPWISNKITKMIKVRNKLFARKKWQPNNAGVCELFKKFRNRINREILKSKKDYFAKYFSDYSNNIKKTWQGIREIINIKNPTAPKIAQLNVNGRIFDNPKDIAENVNDYFVNIGPNTEKEIPKVHNISPTKFLKERNQFNFLIAHISNEEVLDIVNSLSNKATGPYSVPLKLLILISDLIIIPLCYIINMPLFSGIYPDKLKIVKLYQSIKVAPHKISIIFVLFLYCPSLIKLLRKLFMQGSEFLELHHILYVNQFGFRKNNSTIFALMQITEKIKESIDGGKFGCGIFIDLRKAFDTVNHGTLLHKLDHYGIIGSILNWFKSYLTNRKQCLH